MAFGFTQDVPANEEMYRKIRESIGHDRPDGLIAHLALRREDGTLRYVDVWESEAQFETFRLARVEPAVEEVLASYGITSKPPDPGHEVLDVVHAWIGHEGEHG